MKLPIKSRAGFTVPELAIVAGLLGLLSLFSAQMLGQSLKSYRTGHQLVNMQDAAAKGSREFEGKVRYAEQIIVASDTTFSFKAYIANTQRPAPTLITFSLEGEELLRSIIQPTESAIYPGQYEWTSSPEEKVIVKGLRNQANAESLFSYYSDNNYNYQDDSATMIDITNPTDLAELSRIKMVRMNMVIDFDPARSPGAIDETTLVSLRNLKLNL